MNSLVKTYGLFEMIDPRLEELYMESALKVGLLAKLIPPINSAAEITVFGDTLAVFVKQEIIQAIAIEALENPNNPCEMVMEKCGQCAPFKADAITLDIYVSDCPDGFDVIWTDKPCDIHIGTDPNSEVAK